jgi:hypothetical protein
MAQPRAKLSEILKKFSDHVYFQPPTGTKIIYPCIIYKLEKLSVKFADNGPYRFLDEYSVLYITRDPDDIRIHDIALLPLCKLNRTYTEDNLYHYRYTIYN